MTLEARELAQRLVTDREYLAALRKALRSRTIAPRIEQLVWHFAFGKPVTVLELQAPGGAALFPQHPPLRDMTNEALFAHMRDLLAEQEAQLAVNKAPKVKKPTSGDSAE